MSSIYKAAVSLAVCLCMWVSASPLFFRHDRRTATKFGTHIPIDMGKKLTHPSGVLGVKNSIKSPGNVMKCPEINKQFKPPPHPGVGGFTGHHFQKSGKCHELPRKSIHPFCDVCQPLCYWPSSTMLFYSIQISYQAYNVFPISSTYKLERQFFRTGRRIAPKFCTRVRIEKRLDLS